MCLLNKLFSEASDVAHGPFVKCLNLVLDNWLHGGSFVERSCRRLVSIPGRDIT